MSQYIKLLQHNGGFISVLADDDGVIQYTTNDADFTGLPAGTATSAETADVATTADGPTTAGTFSAALNAATDIIVTLAAPGNTLDITGLAGNTDGDYELNGVLTLTGDATQNVITLQPENLATNQSGQFVFGTSSGAATTGGATTFPLGAPTNTADSTFVFKASLTSKAGRVRIFNGYGVGVNTDATRISFNTLAFWSDTTTVITKIRINADHGMTAGFARLRKLGNLT